MVVVWKVQTEGSNTRHAPPRPCPVCAQVTLHPVSGLWRVQARARTISVLTNSEITASATNCTRNAIWLTSFRLAVQFSPASFFYLRD